MPERGSRFEGAEDIAKGMGDWMHETPGHEDRQIDTHEVHGLPRVEQEGSGGLLEKMNQPMAKKVISFLLVAAATGAYVSWFTNSEAATASAGQQIEQKSFEAQKNLWLQKMADEHLSSEEINEVLADPELKQVYEEMAAGHVDSFDEYLAERAISE